MGVLILVVVIIFIGYLFGSDTSSPQEKKHSDTDIILGGIVAHEVWEHFRKD